jgi:hypothetical protein
MAPTQAFSYCPTPKHCHQCITLPATRLSVVQDNAASTSTAVPADDEDRRSFLHLLLLSLTQERALTRFFAASAPLARTLASATSAAVAALAQECAATDVPACVPAPPAWLCTAWAVLIQLASFQPAPTDKLWSGPSAKEDAESPSEGPANGTLVATGQDGVSPSVSSGPVMKSAVAGGQVEMATNDRGGDVVMVDAGEEPSSKDDSAVGPLNPREDEPGRAEPAGGAETHGDEGVQFFHRFCAGVDQQSQSGVTTLHVLCPVTTLFVLFPVTTLHMLFPVVFIYSCYLPAQRSAVRSWMGDCMHMVRSIRGLTKMSVSNVDSHAVVLALNRQHSKAYDSVLIQTNNITPRLFLAFQCVYLGFSS